MGMSEKIKIVMLKRNMKLQELAAILETSPPNLSNKLKRDNFTTNELIQIGNALNCDFNASYTLRDTQETF